MSRDIIWFDTANKMPPCGKLRVLKATREAGPNVVHQLALRAGAGGLHLHRRPPRRGPPHDGRLGSDPDDQRIVRLPHAPTSRTSRSSHFIEIIAKTAARGGNLMLNVGPQGRRHDRPEADVAILKRHRQVDEGQRRIDPRHDAHAAARAGVGRVDAQGQHALPARLRLAERREADRRRAEVERDDTRTCSPTRARRR